MYYEALLPSTTDTIGNLTCALARHLVTIRSRDAPDGITVALKAIDVT